MALVKCSECGHIVSTMAGACPNCAFPVRNAFLEGLSAQPSEEKNCNQTNVSIPNTGIQSIKSNDSSITKSNNIDDISLKPCKGYWRRILSKCTDINFHKTITSFSAAVIVGATTKSFVHFFILEIFIFIFNKTFKEFENIILIYL